MRVTACLFSLCAHVRPRVHIMYIFALFGAHPFVLKPGLKLIVGNIAFIHVNIVPVLSTTSLKFRQTGSLQTAVESHFLCTCPQTLTNFGCQTKNPRL